MRLTLRTLLAWMDDTLEPDQVKEIGKQVAESPFARELTDRINRVTRQRRLSVPSRSGPDGTDPNVVAGYLDNDLDADAVAEFEKVCLTSDVNLAEVASVHQILSLLGHKVKVPDEARKRMYQLVKGREAIAPRRPPRSKPAAKEPVTKPIQPWVIPEAPGRPWIERYGPAVACLLLILVAIWAARESLRVPPAQTVTAPPVAEAVPAVPPTNAPAGEGGMAAMIEGTPSAEPAPPTPSTPETAEAEKTARAADAEKARPAPPPPVVPAGLAGLAEKTDGILLRYNEDHSEGERLLKETPLRVSDRILCLEPFRASIDIGKLRLGLIHETDIRLLSRPGDAVPSIELIQGKVVIRQPGSESLKVAFAKQSVTLEMSSDTVLGMERVPALAAPGRPVTQPMALGVLCQQGEVTLVAGAKRQAVPPQSVVLVSPAGEVQTNKPPGMPPWLTQPEPSEYESQVRDQFIKVFHPDRPVMTELAAAVDDERPEVKMLVIIALKSLGDLSLVVPNLSRPNDPAARRATITALRAYMAQGPEASARVRAALDEEFQDLGGFAQHMLIGYTPEEAARPDLYAKLVDLLSPEQASLGIRELALDALKRLTGRDDLGYDPDKPAGRGFDAWRDLLRRNELRPPAPSAPNRQPKTKGQR